MRIDHNIIILSTTRPAQTSQVLVKTDLDCPFGRAFVLKNATRRICYRPCCLSKYSSNEPWTGLSIYRHDGREHCLFADERDSNCYLHMLPQCWYIDEGPGNRQGASTEGGQSSPHPILFLGGTQSHLVRSLGAARRVRGSTLRSVRGRANVELLPSGRA